jgi:hypothetical protein
VICLEAYLLKDEYGRSNDSEWIDSKLTVWVLVSWMGTPDLKRTVGIQSWRNRHYI